MIENSGFLSEEEERGELSNGFSEVEILGRSATNIYGRADRYGKRWFFKGVSPEARDVAAASLTLLKEFDIQIGLAHPGVERMICIDKIEGIGRCLIAEWIEGATLEELLEEESLTSADKFRILLEIIDAVDYLHSQGIVHRDLKPKNIMIRKNGKSAVVIDFGLADTDAHLYQKLPAGTRGYASPRQHRAHTPFTGDDIHALGMIMRQLCPGLSTLSKDCVAGKYPTAEALRLALESRARRRRIVSVSVSASLVLVLVLSLFGYISSLKNNTIELRNQTGSLRDSLTLFSRQIGNEQTLRDSLQTVNQQLQEEKAFRVAQEERKARIEEIKSDLNNHIDRAYSNFLKTLNDSESEFTAHGRLADILKEAIDASLSRHRFNTLSDAEKSEIIYAYTNHINQIFAQWRETRKQSIEYN